MKTNKGSVRSSLAAVTKCTAVRREGGRRKLCLPFLLAADRVGTRGVTGHTRLYGQLNLVRPPAVGSREGRGNI